VQKAYVRHVRTFTAFLGRSPDTATSDDLRRFPLHLAQQPISAGSINAAIAALRFFFTVTLERPDLVRPLRTVNKPRRAPVVLSQEEVGRLLEAAPSLKYKAALSAAYGAGLRVSEVANLKVSDIPGSSPGTSHRMMLRVEQGKGQRDRYVMLSPQLLELLRDWWRAARPPVWLFPGQNPINPITPRQLNRAVTAAKDLAGISKRISPHTPRVTARGFATHLREQGVDIRVIRVLLGHAKLETTALYTRVAVSTVRDIKSPLERLGVNLASRSPPA
jgi:integrase/recombinase XerD